MTEKSITVERSQREEGGQVWWWLHGDTYSHRELLKRYGARFSGKRKAWYWVGTELPATIYALVTSEAQGDSSATQPEAASPMLKIFGGYIVSKEHAANGDTILKGGNGVFATRATWIDQNDQPEAVWVFDLPPHNRLVISLPEIHDALKKAHAIFSIYTRKWHFDQTDKVAAMDALAHTVAFNDDSPVILPTEKAFAIPDMSPELVAMIDQALAQDTSNIPVLDVPDVQLPEQSAAPTIRIIKPVPMPLDGEALDAVQTAVRELKTMPIITSVNTPKSNGRITPIAQSYVGELTGSITGQVFCYGYALHENVCVYLNMAGPRMACEAIRAKLSKGDILSVVPPDAPATELTAGEGNSGMYHPYLHYLPEARFASLILVHDWAVTPNYGGKATTFIFRTSDAQATAKLKHHVMQLVNIPVFESWSAYLYEAGQRAMLVRKTRSAAGIDLLSVDLDADAWTRLITGGLEQGIIALSSSVTAS